jgi:hypothetical protein
LAAKRKEFCRRQKLKDGECAFVAEAPIGALCHGSAADGEQWFTFTVREDSMIGMRIGETITVTGDSGRPIDARVIEIRPLGEFATWRAARAVGDHDLNSFWVRLDPLVKHEELKPGMTVWIPGRS